MCGIIGILGRSEVAPLLMDGLRRLEYRGYDSAGVATLIDGRIERRRAEGKLDRLAARLAEAPVEGRIGIGHTRWATHGVPSENNAHPIASDRVAVVHNGIIENFQALKDELTGARPSLRDRDRHRSGSPSHHAISARGADADRCGGQDPAAARRRVRAGDAVRGRGRFADRRAAQQPARGRLRRGRDVSRLRRAGAGAADPPHPLSRRGRLGRGDAAPAPPIRDARQ